MEKEWMNSKLPDTVVLDSSVVVKWFRRYETLQEQALQLRRAYLDGHLSIYVPDLLIYEIANVLRYKPDMNECRVQQAVQSLFDMRIGIEHIGSEAIQKVVKIAYSYGVTVYDAVFAVLAEQLEADFITADQRLVQKLHDVPYVHHLASLAC
jgi:predicted nucleic acid-binding protein